MPSLSDNDKQEILKLARNCLREAIYNKRKFEEVPEAGVFAMRAGAFVSLHRHGKLRGCIGIVEPMEPLGKTIAHCAVSAAREDPRFASLRPEEVEDVEIEVSLLSEPELIAPENIVIGQHGLLIEQGRRRGLLLPQVAVEHHLDPVAFLSETCRKAGLPTDAWRSKETEIYGFTCQIIGPHTQ